MKAHFKRNNRLAWAFKICKDLGIDDPAYWMEKVIDPATLDSWIAFYQFEAELESGSQEKSPQSALEQLGKL